MFANLYFVVSTFEDYVLSPGNMFRQQGTEDDYTWLSVFETYLQDKGQNLEKANTKKLTITDRTTHIRISHISDVCW